jgi:cytochrome c peroxidase
MLRFRPFVPQLARVVSRVSLVVAPALFSVGCQTAANPEPEAEQVGTTAQAVTTDPVSICNQDPRVWAGLVPLNVCAGARVFFDETFSGNGRACGTCHPAANNFTIDKPFIDTLPATNPLFVNESSAFPLAGLETPDLRSQALIKENVDGFEDNEHKFVERAVSHTLSLALTLERDPADGTSASVVQRTGWGGDGAPGDGSLRSFIDGAIVQHYPKDLGRTPGSSFRVATTTEKDQILAFQLALGRTNELNLNQVTLTDAGAAQGKAAFLDPLQGRCNECHKNAGATALLSGKNRNFNTGTIKAPTSAVQQTDGSFLFDGGFGGLGLSTPNLVTVTGVPDAFGDGSFSPPPLVEAADTGPFFHTNAFGDVNDATNGIEGAVSFYASNLFLDSPAAQELNARFGGQPVNVGPVIGQIGRFLRVLNASFNLAIADQRLIASRTLNVQFWAFRDDIQKGLLNLASEEIDDAIRVLERAGGDLHSAQVTALNNAKTLLAQAVAATDPAVRRDRTDAAKTIVNNAKAAFGTNLNFQLGSGNLMF